MTVGILTFHLADNFGAVLQLYALQTYLGRSGHDATIIDYQPRYLTDGGPFRFARSKKDIYANATVLFIKLSRLRAALRGGKRKKAFQRFRERMLNVGAPTYPALEMLRADPPACDAYICGSDQIWNPPPRAGVDPAFYLAFGDASVRRIAYAASFGRAHVAKEYRQEIGELLCGLDAISVREESGLRLVQELSTRQAEWLPDPTLLLDDYASVLVPPSEDEFVFGYCLRTSALIGQIQKQIAAACGLPLLTPYDPQQRWRARGTTLHLGPAEWLGCIAQARFVVTNSFHGTLFSILFRKAFITVPLVRRHEDLNERFRSVLCRLNLENRLLAADQPRDVQRLIETPIDWDDVGARLDSWRTEAAQFLTNALR